jgi:hypothetical protein
MPDAARTAGVWLTFEDIACTEVDFAAVRNVNPVLGVGGTANRMP